MSDSAPAPPRSTPAFWWLSVLGAAVGFFLMRSRPLSWDALSFLGEMGRYNHRDLVHLLYVPALEATESLLAPVGLDRADCARALSAVSAAFALGWFHSLLRALDRPPALALGATLLLATSPPFLDQALRVEVYAPALAAALLSLRCAALARRRQSGSGCCLAAVLLLFSATFHLGTLTLTPILWMILGPELPRRCCAAGLGVTGSGALGYALISGRLDPAIFERWAQRIRSFLPPRPPQSSYGESLATHGDHLGRFLSENAPALALCGALGFLFALRGQLPGAKLTLAWCLPGLLLFALLGTPLLGLLLPALLGLAWAASLLPRPGFAAPALLILLAGFQLGLGWEARRNARQEDLPTRDARAITAVLPEGAELIAGECARHLQLLGSSSRIIALADEVQAAEGDDPATALLAVLDRLIADIRARGHRPLISMTALGQLLARGVPLEALKTRVVGVTPALRGGERPSTWLYDLQTASDGR